jgi:hypothetical protein
MTSSEIGRWKVVDQIWVNTDKALDYLEHRQQRVGYAKSAWAECARILGGMRGMPTWVSRQKNKRGTVTDDTKRRSFPVVTLHALPDYMSRVLSESRKRDAINLQRKNFRKHIETTIKKAAREASATR